MPILLQWNLFHSNLENSFAALSSQVQVADRPMTQQGLGGMKTGQRSMSSFEVTNSDSPAINHLHLELISHLCAKAVFAIFALIE